MTTTLSSDRQLRSQSLNKTCNGTPDKRQTYLEPRNSLFSRKSCEIRRQKTLYYNFQQSSVDKCARTNSSLFVIQKIPQKHIENIKQDFEMATRTFLLREKAEKQQIKSFRSSFRMLLPDYLNAKFPQNLAQIFNIASKIDNYLLTLPTNLARQSFINLQSYLLNIQGIQLKEDHFRQINFFAPKYYKYFKDPFQNLIIQHPKDQSPNLRYQSLKKLVHSFFLNKIQSDFKYQIMMKQLFTKRIGQFYENKFFQKKLKKQQKKNRNIKDQFIKQIMNSINRKEQQLNQYKGELGSQDIAEQDIKYFKNLIKEIYTNKKVSNMFKVTLVQIINQKSQKNKIQILNGLQYLLKKQQILKQISIKDHAVINYERQEKTK